MNSAALAADVSRETESLRWDARMWPLNGHAADVFAHAALDGHNGGPVGDRGLPVRDPLDMSEASSVRDGEATHARWGGRWAAAIPSADPIPPPAPAARPCGATGSRVDGVPRTPGR